MKGTRAYAGAIKLAGLLILLPLLIWSRGIRPTLELHRSIREQAVRIEETRIDTLKRDKPDSLRGLTEDGVRSGAVLYRLTPLLERHGVTAESYTPYRFHAGEGTELYGGELVLSGGFLPLTRLLDEFQRQTGTERIVSVRYAPVVHPQTRKQQLQMTVILQQITQIE